MTTSSGIVGGLALGAGWGVVSSLTNAADSSFWAATSLIANAGWAWAGVAVTAGWLSGSRARGAVAGVLTLIAMTTAYYGADSVFRQEPFVSYWDEMRVWWLVSLVLGSVLGAVGASIRRPGVLGLIAGLMVPVGAAVEMIWIPRWSGVEPGLDLVRLLVLTAAIAIASIVIARFYIAKRSRRRYEPAVTHRNRERWPDRGATDLETD